MPVDYFTIKNRIYQSGDPFKQIQQITGTDGSELYQFNDEQSNPGIIYEYQVVGVTNCADVTIYTDTLYTYGFRTPTGDIYGRVTFTLHYTPSCCGAEVIRPGYNWTYNTKRPTVNIDGVDKHYMDIRISGFDVNNDNFHYIKLQYKSSAQSDDSWVTLMKFCIASQFDIQVSTHAVFFNNDFEGRIAGRQSYDKYISGSAGLVWYFLERHELSQ